MKFKKPPYFLISQFVIAWMVVCKCAFAALNFNNPTNITSPIITNTGINIGSSAAGVVVNVIGPGVLETTAGNFIVGTGHSNNQLLIASGGLVRVTNSSQELIISLGSAGIGSSIRVTGSASVLSAYIVNIGNNALGYVTIDNGGTLTATQVNVGKFTGSSGILSVSSGGRILAQDLYVGSKDGSGNPLASGQLNLYQPQGVSLSGNFEQYGLGTTTVMGDGSGNYGSLFANGVISLAGTLSINGAPRFGDQPVFLTSAIGGLIGSFDSIVLPAGFRGRLYLTTNTASILLAPASYTQLAQTPNQYLAAKALDTFIPATSGDKYTVSVALDHLSSGQYPTALNAISPQFYQSLSTIAFNLVNAQYNDLVQQMFGLRVAGTGFSMSGFADNTAMIQEGQGDGDKNPKNDVLRPGADTRWGMFVDGNGIFAQANSGNMLPSYNAQSGGLISGLTYKWCPEFTTGIYAGYEGSYGKYSGYNSGSTVIDNAVRFGLLGTYGQRDGKGFYGDALIGGSYNNYSVTRSITFPGINRTANSTPGAGELDSMIAAGYNWRKGNWSFGPVSSLQYTYFGMNSFSETGAQSLDLQGLGWNTASMIYNLGGNCAYAWQANRDLMVVPQINLAWQHEFLQNPYAINGTMGGAGISSTSATPLRDTLYTGVGVTLEWKKRWNTAFFYNAAAGNSDLVSQNIFWSAGVKF